LDVTSTLTDFEPSFDESTVMGAFSDDPTGYLGSAAAGVVGKLPNMMPGSELPLLLTLSFGTTTN
jgi:hypothetical protein